MTRSYPRFLLVALALLPTAARASDFSGVVTILFGLPAVLVAVLLAAGFFAFRPSHRQRLLAVLLFSPVLVAGVWVLVVDTSQMIQRGLPTGLALGIGYIALLIVLVVLVGRILRRPLAPPASAEKPKP